MTAATVGLAGALLAVFALRHFASVLAATVCAALFATTPLVCAALDARSPYLAMLPGAILWIIALQEYLRRPRTPWLIASAVTVSSLLYVHAAGAVMAPAYAAIVVAALLTVGPRPAILFVLVAAAAALPWLITIARDPTPMVSAISALGVYDTARFNMLQGAREMTSWVGLTVRAEAWWDSLNPSLLFLGQGEWTASLRHPRMFWFPLSVPFVMGLAHYASVSSTVMERVLLAAFLASPLVAAVIGARPEPQRLMLMVPIVVIIATRPLVRLAGGSLPPARR
jgi:hypothetical protein